VRAALSRAVPLVAVLAAAAPVAQARAAELGERTLERGDRGDDVRQLQELLTKLDLETDPDGVFGAGTVTHVKAYERREDLPVDGRVSPGRVDYPFNLSCGNPDQYESDIRMLIWGDDDIATAPVTIHLACGDISRPG